MKNIQGLIDGARFIMTSRRKEGNLEKEAENLTEKAAERRQRSRILIYHRKVNVCIDNKK